MLDVKGKFSIFELDNIVDPIDAMYVNLKERANVEKLVMALSTYYFGSSRDRSNEMKVFKLLQPHKKLRKLSIGCGLVGQCSQVGLEISSQLVELRLIGCKNCTLFPPLERLTSLKVLVI